MQSDSELSLSLEQEEDHDLFPCSSTDTGILTTNTSTTQSSTDSNTNDEAGTDQAFRYNNDRLPIRRIRTRRVSFALTAESECLPKYQEEKEHSTMPGRPLPPRGFPRILIHLIACVFLLYSWSAMSLSRYSLARNWLTARQARRLVRKIQQKPVHHTKFTILLSGSRIDLLQQSLDFHARCPMVANILIDWDDSSDIPEILLEHSSRKVHSMKETVIPTEGAFLLKEGLVFTCAEMQRAFHEWKLDPVRLVGLAPLCKTCRYNLISDSAAFIHRLFLKARPVLKDPTCQHLALSAQLAARTSKTPINVLARTRIELLETYSLEKEIPECVNELAKIFRFEPTRRKVLSYVGRD